MYMNQLVQGLQIFGLGRVLIQVNWMFCINISEIWMVSLGFFSFRLQALGSVPGPVLTRSSDSKENQQGGAERVHFYLRK